MEQPGSDQENLDSETSQSSESLLDELQRSSVHISEPDGQYQVAQPGLLSFCPFPSALWVSDKTTGPLGGALPVFCGAGLDQ